MLSSDKDVEEGVWVELIKEVDQNSDGKVKFTKPQTDHSHLPLDFAERV